MVAQDGVSYNTPVTIAAGTPLTLGTGGRYSILVTASSVANQNVQLFINSSNNSNLGTNNYFVKMTSVGSAVTPLTTPTTLTTTGYKAFVDLSTATVDETRTVTFTINPNPQGNGNNSQFQINDEVFPNPQISQPMINDVEEWTLINNSKIPHPFHYHVNDIQVMSMFVPSNTKNTGLVTVTTPSNGTKMLYLFPLRKLIQTGL